MPKSAEFWITAIVLVLAVAVFAIWRGRDVVVKIGGLLFKTTSNPAKPELSDKVRVAEGVKVGPDAIVGKIVGEIRPAEGQHGTDIQVARDMKVDGIVGEITGVKIGQTK